MLLLVGLGNPGSNYTNTRHNIGFKIIDAINLHFKLSKQKPKFKGLLTTGNIDSKKIVLRQADISSTGKIINEEVTVNYGVFIETFIDFMIVAFTIFIVIKFLNKLKVQAEDPNNNKVSTPRNIKLLTEINHSLKDLNKNLTKKN